jgi:hypothetical protein
LHGSDGLVEFFEGTLPITLLIPLICKLRHGQEGCPHCQFICI